MSNTNPALETDPDTTVSRTCSWILAAAPKTPFVRLLVVDPVVTLYLQSHSSASLLSPREVIIGFEAYIIESWACSRSHPSSVLCIQTNDPAHKITAAVFGVPTNEAEWSPSLCRFLDSFDVYHAEPVKVGFGTLMVATDSSFPSGLNALRVPQGNLSQLMSDFVINTNLKLLGCVGRAQLTLSKPNDATVTKFRRYKTDEACSLDVGVVEIGRIVQTCLFLFGKLRLDAIDGFLCDVTMGALRDWWVEFATDFFVRPTIDIIDPSVVAALFGLLAGARYRLESVNAPVSKFALDIESMVRGITHFQNTNDLPTTGRLDLHTFGRLHRKTGKVTYGGGRTGQRSVKSAVAEIGGKGVDMVMGMIGRERETPGVETDSFEDFLANIKDEPSAWVWYHKGKKIAPTSAVIIPLPYLLFPPPTMAGARHTHHIFRPSPLPIAGGSQPPAPSSPPAKPSARNTPMLWLNSKSPIPTFSRFLQPSRNPSPFGGGRDSPDGFQPQHDRNLAVTDPSDCRPALPLTPGAPPFDPYLLPEIPTFPPLDIDNKDIHLISNMNSLLRRSQSETRLSNLHPIERAECVKALAQRIDRDVVDLDTAIDVAVLEDAVFDPRLPRSVSFSAAETAVLWWSRIGVDPIRPARMRSSIDDGGAGGFRIPDDTDIFDPTLYESSALDGSNEYVLSPSDPTRFQNVSHRSRVVSIHPSRHRDERSQSRRLRPPPSLSAAPSTVVSPGMSDYLSPQSAATVTGAPYPTPFHTQLNSPIPNTAGMESITGGVVANTLPMNPPPSAALSPMSGITANPARLAGNTDPISFGDSVAGRQAYSRELNQRTAFSLARTRLMSTWLRYVIPAQSDLHALRALDQQIQKIQEAIEKVIPPSASLQLDMAGRLMGTQPVSAVPGWLTGSRMPGQIPGTPVRAMMTGVDNFDNSSVGPGTDTESGVGTASIPPSVSGHIRPDQTITPPNTATGVPIFHIPDFDDRIGPAMDAAHIARYSRDDLEQRVLEFEAELDRLDREADRVEARVLDLGGRLKGKVYSDKSRRRRSGGGGKSGAAGSSGSADRPGDGDANGVDENDDDEDEDDYSRNLSATAGAIRKIVHSVSVPGVVHFLSHPAEWWPAVVQASADAAWTKWWGWRGMWRANPGSQDDSGGGDGGDGVEK